MPVTQQWEATHSPIIEWSGDESVGGWNIQGLDGRVMNKWKFSQVNVIQGRGGRRGGHPGQWEAFRRWGYRSSRLGLIHSGIRAVTGNSLQILRVGTIRS